MDDPLVWGFLPLKYNFGLSSSNRRWGMASHDICYQARSAHSKHGGIAQPAVTQAIRLLSKGPFPAEPHLAKPERQSWSLQNVCVDPFSDLPTAYTTDGEDSHLAPSAYSCNSYSWVHIFPEGKIHQSPNKTMRYFKWGVARLILEASECPDIVPMWLEGFDQVMHESREFPRFLPRPGKEVSVTFGQKVDTEAVFGEMRRRWQKLKAKAELASPETRDLPLGALSDELLYGDEAVELRKEVTKKVRDLVLEVRRSRGHSDEDPKAGLVETWMEEGGKREGKMKDESWKTLGVDIIDRGRAHLSDLSHDDSVVDSALALYCSPLTVFISLSIPHYSLSSSSHNSQNDRFRTPDRPSVNDLIDHLRRTQLSPSGLDKKNRNIPRYVTPRSVHPSLRNVLELPETPPPRPRPDARRTGLGQRRLRRTPGPPPPESWLSGNTSAAEDEDAELNAAETAKIFHRLERLPGSVFPARSSFLHAVLKSMAMHWAWHVDYDGQFLGFLPTHIKVLLLSYIAYYARMQPLGMRGLKPLFDNTADVDVVEHGRLADGNSHVTRLDLSGALGRWISLKQLFAELILSKRNAGSAQDGTTKAIPLSWEDEYENDAASGTAGAISKPLSHLRFTNLQYLSLAHPQKATVSWNSLINLLSHLSTITHLSLAHWPVPMVTPNAINARVRHPTHRSLTFSYGGTDSYSAMENNWAESAGILRRLSRATYCLKWLDLEGCADWIPALNWEGVGPNGEMYSTGPEWNGSWRDIEWIRLGPGWLPHLQDSELATLSGAASTSNINAPSPRSLASSIHAPAASDVSTETWDVELERQKYRRAKELERFRETMHDAKEVQQRVLRARKDGRGKWVHFSFGLEELTSDVRDRLLGEELRNKFL
ncbi:hypothetical protein AN6375.2 [Aspergillus nidulans FGSC A4]|uniref:Tafazzin (AFU_orthologue AFUA_2G13960) n=1 Tax=Emericella nidulans (strain FGSC A4 / ATCC 38163 / CBS 112.46 / NRRL 194 / M139) TaxID=227321 RepID=Q5AZA5_EMENI|nr:hypothetical protein [Aspergillus nidulans FGSC A4]EAA58759.1 hypothetical protein AN6375.2 [Aspergillus nidulans FGSC A4]CBF69598.1 TPA: tafazzin (AFU_orthologue; AFUA_2G13960) [Aspergillus nidulans FGSC A4]|eukprot:XP_663979.1 hypothetical protein AN6375.2 [Aspergillus nidulans FGSC A4]